jgi:hypothetical protein
MNIAHDKACSNGANPKISFVWKKRQVLQIQINVHSIYSLCPVCKIGAMHRAEQRSAGASTAGP